MRRWGDEGTPELVAVKRHINDDRNLSTPTEYARALTGRVQLRREQQASSSSNRARGHPESGGKIVVAGGAEMSNRRMEGNKETRLCRSNADGPEPALSEEHHPSVAFCEAKVERGNSDSRHAPLV